MAAVRLTEVRDRIAAAAARSGRAAADVTLVAVGKAHPPELLAAAYAAGHRVFGENRAQELAAKAPHLPPDVEWHFIGPLQRNKVRLVRPVVALLESMDRPALAAAWARGGDAPPVLVEVNIAAESQKAGVDPARAGELVDRLSELGVEVRGLMAIPPAAPDPEESRPHFRALAALAGRLRADHPALVELSMGMTADYEVAVEEGATIVRVGRAIFGPRPT